MTRQGNVIGLLRNYRVSRGYRDETQVRAKRTGETQDSRHPGVFCLFAFVFLGFVCLFFDFRHRVSVALEPELELCRPGWS